VLVLSAGTVFCLALFLFIRVAAPCLAATWTASARASPSISSPLVSSETYIQRGWCRLGGKRDFGEIAGPIYQTSGRTALIWSAPGLAWLGLRLFKGERLLG
jgi:hypothetical protein